MLEPQLVRTSHTPLYRQLADALSYGIATGSLAAGARLPSLRQGQDIWGVSLHTVRRAYAQLEKAGLVWTAPRTGTVVGSSPAADFEPPATGPDDLRRLIAKFLSEADRRYGLPREELLAAVAREATRPAPAIVVVECSRSLTASLAAQISRAWNVKCSTHLVGAGPPPPGVVVSTFFHFNELRTVCSDRLAEVSFVRIRPSSRFAIALRQRIETAGPDVVLLETDPAFAHNVSVDLRHQFPAAKFEVFIAEAGRDLPPHDGRTLVVSPQNWDRLTAESNPPLGAMMLEYEIEQSDLQQLGAERGWRG